MVDLPVAPARAGWWAALVVVPLALAGVALVWPGVPGAPAVPAPTAAAAPPAPAPTAAAAGPAPAARQRVAEGLAAAGPITFAADSAALPEASRVAVARVAAVLLTDPSVPVSVLGYSADAPGPAEVAQRLSEQRAAAVADALAAAGVARGRLTTVGRGDAAPLATAAASRRVELRVS